jgi:hypothetical protein
VSIKTVYVKITMSAGDVWYSSSLQHKSTPEKTVKHLNDVAKLKNIGATYELATREQYVAYREEGNRIIADAKARAQRRAA